MITVLEIRLEARHPAANRLRRYRLSLGQDLLGDWVLVAAYGRIGSAGQERQWVTPDAAAIKAVLAERLARRGTAPRRLGCAYRVVEVDLSPGTVVTDWIDPSTVERFRLV